MRVRPLGRGKREAKYAVWSIADITRDRERQEDVFQELQHAIEYLDHAPCGFFSVNAAGDIVYVNATLANWLDHDLAEIGSGGLKLTDIVSGDGASLLTSIGPAPGEVKTEVFDIDLRMRGGKTMPVRLYHKLAFGADGAPGASRTLVISRARDERSDPQRAAESASCASSTIRRWRSRPWTARARWSGRRALCQAGAKPEPRRRRQQVDYQDRHARDRHLLIAAINQAAGRAGRYCAGRGHARQRPGSVGGSSSSPRSRKMNARPRPQSSTCWTRRTAGAGEPDQPVAEDGHGRPARRRHRARFQQRALRHHDGERLPAERAQADRSSFQDIMQIKQNATRAATLVRQLLAFSRRQTLRPQVLDLGDALSDLTMLLRRLIGEKVKLDLVHGRDLWPVKVDVSQFEQGDRQSGRQRP